MRNITERDKIEEFLEYYNQIYEVVDNDGTWNMTSEHMLVVYLKSGAEIIIQDGGGRDFNIDFLNSEYDSLSYWGKQENIYNMLMYNHY